MMFFILPLAIIYGFVCKVKCAFAIWYTTPELAFVHRVTVLIVKSALAMY
jgi:hypothetical protein